MVAGKRGAIDAACPPILERSGVRPSSWLKMIEQSEAWFHGAVGHAKALAEKATSTGRHWIQGLSHCRDAFT